MERLNLPFYYQLGAVLNPLVQTNAATTKVQLYVGAFLARPILKTLLDSVQSLKVCRPLADGLFGAIDAMDAALPQLKPEQLNEPIQPGEVAFQNVAMAAAQFQVVLAAELATQMTFHVTPKGIYDTANLVEQAERCLPDTTQAVISEVAKGELRQAGRCLALDSPTACAFHMMRALEAVMHQYYVAMCTPSSNEPLGSWAEYIAKLRKAAGLDNAEATISDANAIDHVKLAVPMLQQIKDQDRNLIMHPEIVLTPEEASSLFEVAKAAIILMAARLPVRAEEPSGD